MSQAARPLRLSTDEQPLPGLVLGPLSPAQHLEALRRVQAQAEQRLKLGSQLFKAAQAQTLQQRTLAEELRRSQDGLREEMRQDATKTLHQCEQWMGAMDDRFTSRIRQLEDRLDVLHGQWTEAQQRIDGLMRRAETLLDQSRTLLDHTVAPAGLAVAAAAAAAPAAPAKVEQAESGPLYTRLLDKLRERKQD
jgi:hypothetical protein